MKTRSGAFYPKTCTDFFNGVHNVHNYTGNNDFSHLHDHKFEVHHRRKRAKNSLDIFDALPDDLIVCILTSLSFSAACPADLISVLLTCKRLNELGLNSIVLSKASPKTFAIKAKNWCDSCHRFLKLCSDSGNADACYTLGMIRFYCLQNRGSGASLMAKAAIKSHAQALYSLAVIQFNGSGGTKNDKNLRAGVALCTRAAFYGHVDALRELGHCLQDGYGVRQSVTEGRRFLLQANARELLTWTVKNLHVADMVTCQRTHPVNLFLMEWYSGQAGSGLRLCSNGGCGRPETRKHEFRRCSVCGVVNYCSRACQALDWKVRHKVECDPLPPLGGVDGGDGEVEVMNGMDTDDGDR